MTKSVPNYIKLHIKIIARTSVIDLCYSTFRAKTTKLEEKISSILIIGL